jgi:hypothetical protein
LIKFDVVFQHRVDLIDLVVIIIPVFAAELRRLADRSTIVEMKNSIGPVNPTYQVVSKIRRTFDWGDGLGPAFPCCRDSLFIPHVEQLHVHVVA